MSCWLLAACGVAQPAPAPGSATLTLLHTSDLHSRVLPFRARISGFEASLGLGEAGALEEVGGFARLASVVEQERSRGAALWLDSGDVLEGSPIFERFGGRVEVELLSGLGLAALGLGNHELSLSGAALRGLFEVHAELPLLASNLQPGARSELRGLLRPSTVLQAGGLELGIVAAANPSSPPDLASSTNRWALELAPDAAAAVQAAIDELAPRVDLVIVLSHLGLDADRQLVAATSGIGLLLGGHQHIVTKQPDWQDDCSTERIRRERACSSERVPIIHSGAYGKLVSRVALTLASRVSAPGFRVTEVSLTQLPLARGVPERSDVLEYVEALRGSPQPPLGFLPAGLQRRSALGGDSPLGNLTTDAVRDANGVDVALLNSSGLRDDLVAGVLLEAELELAFPFAEAWQAAWLSGRELRAGLARAARRSAERGCVSTVQVSGLKLRVNCAACEQGPACLEVTRSTATGPVAMRDDELLLVAMPAYLALSGGDFAGTRGAPLALSVVDALERAIAQRPSEADSSACAAALRGLSSARCRSAFGELGCPASASRAQAWCRGAPVLRGGRDDRIQVLP